MNSCFQKMLTTGKCYEQNHLHRFGYVSELKYLVISHSVQCTAMCCSAAFIHRENLAWSHGI